MTYATVDDVAVLLHKVRRKGPVENGQHHFRGAAKFHAAWTGHKSITWDEPTVRSFDCIIISTKHKAFNLDELVAWSSCIVDTRNALAKHQGKPGQITKA